MDPKLIGMMLKGMGIDAEEIMKSGKEIIAALATRVQRIDEKHDQILDELAHIRISLTTLASAEQQRSNNERLSLPVANSGEQMIHDMGMLDDAAIDEQPPNQLQQSAAQSGDLLNARINHGDQ